MATAGGYGAIRVNNGPVIPLPFPQPYKDLDVLIGDWMVICVVNKNV
jgi:hypothetical protein